MAGSTIEQQIKAEDRRIDRVGLLIGALSWLAFWPLLAMVVPDGVDGLAFRLPPILALVAGAVLHAVLRRHGLQQLVTTLALVVANAAVFALVAANDFDAIYVFIAVVHAVSSASIVRAPAQNVTLLASNVTFALIAGLVSADAAMPPVVVAATIALLDLSNTINRYRMASRAAKAIERGRLLDRFFDHTSDGLLLVGAHGRVVRSNPAAAALLGADPDGRAIASMLGPGAPEIAGRSHWQGLVTLPGGDDDPTRNADAVIDHDPDLDLHVVRLADATDRLRTEARLREARDEAEAGARARDAFMALVSHELRTPLHGVLGSLHLIDEGEPYEAVAEPLRSSALRLQSRLDAVLAFSAATADAHTLLARSSDVRAELIGAVGAWKGALDVRLTCDPQVPARLIAPMERLSTILSQLLDNVHEHAPGARATVHAHLSEPERLRIEICDDGPGMSADEIALACAPFALSDVRRRTAGGLGLGLALSTTLARQIGGELTVTASAGGGTRVVVDLPCASAPSRHRCPTQRTPAETRILIVEDDPTNRMILRAMLRRLGCAVDEAVDGEDGVARVREQPYHLVLMDLHMPRLTGWEACARMGELLDAPPPVVAVTASVAADDHRAALDAGMVALLPKPVPIEALRAVIEHLAGVRWPDQQAA